MGINLLIKVSTFSYSDMATYYKDCTFCGSIDMLVDLNFPSIKNVFARCISSEYVAIKLRRTTALHDMLNILDVTFLNAENISVIGILNAFTNKNCNDINGKILWSQRLKGHTVRYILACL